MTHHRFFCQDVKWAQLGPGQLPCGKVSSRQLISHRISRNVKTEEDPGETGDVGIAGISVLENISVCVCVCVRCRGKDVKGKRSFFSPLTSSLNGKNNTDRSCRSSNSEVRCAGQQNDAYFELRVVLCDGQKEGLKATFVVVAGISPFFSQFMVYCPSVAS